MSGALPAAPAPAADADQRAAIERRTAAEARRFELPALFELLFFLGYRKEEITLESHRTTLQQSAVVESVHFAPPPLRRVTVTVNLGWLGPQTALPVYFQRILEQDQGERAERLLSFFSQTLLRAGLVGSFPDRDSRLFVDFDRTRHQLRSLLGARSLSTVHWVFAQTFPELEVGVQRTILLRPLRTRGMVLGDWALGDGMALGGLAQVPVSAIAVTLHCNEPTDGLRTAWAVEAERRLHRECFPSLRSPGLFLRVLLLIRDQSSFMVLREHQYLGYEALSGAPSELPAPTARTGKLVRTTVLWSGEVPPPQEEARATAARAVSDPDR